MNHKVILIIYSHPFYVIICIHFNSGFIEVKYFLLKKSFIFISTAKASIEKQLIEAMEDLLGRLN